MDIICGNCSLANPSNAKFCKGCGYELIPPDKNEQSTKTTSTKEQEPKAEVKSEQSATQQSATQQSATQQSATQQSATQQSVNGPIDRKHELPPKTYLVHSILATIFCCLPFGIVGIVYAAGVESAFYRGYHDLALQKSRRAKIWTIVAIIVGLIGGFLYLLLILGGAIASKTLLNN
ncbi:MAG: CD225/dispanin family protein [Bacteroidales bacterium]|nr:CD225/dispanin family protein [Bacteroidales bacterium]